MTEPHFLEPAQPSPEADALFADDVEDVGYVMNVSRLWAHQPATVKALFDLMGASLAGHGFSFRQRGILVTACASAFGDSYCSLAWGSKLAGAADAATAAGVLAGTDEELTDQERALAAWARQVARDPNAIAATDVQALRTAGLTDAQIFALTTFVALRLAFSTVNDALGARPDAQLCDEVPAPVLDAVTFGRAVAGELR